MKGGCGYGWGVGTGGDERIYQGSRGTIRDNSFRGTYGMREMTG